MASDPSDVSWLFASAPDLVLAYGAPSASSISTSLQQSSQVLNAACATSEARPNLALYAPAYTGQYQFPVILQVCD